MPIAPKPPQIIPYLFYNDIGAALDFLTRAFGFKEEMRVGTPSGGMHGEASFQGQLVMMGQGRMNAACARLATQALRRWACSFTSTRSTSIAKSPRLRARKSSIRRKTSNTAAPIGRTIPRDIRGSSQVLRRGRTEPRPEPLAVTADKIGEPCQALIFSDGMCDGGALRFTIPR